MATITPTWAIAALPWTESAYSTGKSPKGISPSWQLITITWTNLNSGTSDLAVAAPAGYLVDASVQFTGTVTSLALHGSHDGSNFVALKDTSNTAITAIAAAGIIPVNLRTIHVKPIITTGTAVNVIICGYIPIR
jgi:hypothetical protein